MGFSGVFFLGDLSIHFEIDPILYILEILLIINQSK